MYTFGKRSKENLDTVCEPMRLICEEVIKHMDISVIEGHRTLERQKKLYDEGKSQIDGIAQKGNHNYMPSLAVDVIPYEKGVNPFDGTEKSELMFYRMNREFQRASNKLGIEITWGGNWSFKDMPHYEIKQ